MLDLVKARLGISSNVRDVVLNALIQGVENDFLKIYKLDIVTYKDLACDLVVFRYESKGEDRRIPKHIHVRIREAQLHGTVSNAN